MRYVDAIFDLAFRPFEAHGAVSALVFFSLAAGLLVCIIFRFAANPLAIRRAKDRVQAEILGVRLFRDQLGVALGCYLGIIRRTGAYLRQAAAPTAIAVAPLALLFLQLDARIGWLPPQPGADFLLTAQAVPGIVPERLALELSNGVQLTAPPVRIPYRRQVTWRLRADSPGNFLATITGEGRAATKILPVGPRLTRVSPTRSRGGFFSALVDTGELPLPAGSPVQAIEIEHEPRSFALGSWTMEWWIAFLILVFASAWAAKPITGAEF
jgi:hypothetical protein